MSITGRQEAISRFNKGQRASARATIGLRGTEAFALDCAVEEEAKHRDLQWGRYLAMGAVCFMSIRFLWQLSQKAMLLA